MRQLYYTVLTILRGHGSNVIKVISLTLGLFIGIILFARVSYELSYDTGYKDHDRLSIILSQMPGEISDKYIRAFVPQALIENFPDEVESGTLIYNIGENSFYVGNERFLGNVILADTLFFETMGIPLTSGMATGLAMPNHAFVSEEFASRAFHTKDVIGKTLMQKRNRELTIRGTFQNVADNNSIRPDIVLAYGEERTILGVAFNGYIRLHENADIRKVNEKMDAVIEKYAPNDRAKQDNALHFFLEDMRKEHNSNSAVKRVVFVLSFLAVALLLISAMNYVLISISGLSRRIKGIAIHKCNGASSRTVLSMFFWETAIIVFISVLIVILLIINLNSFIGDLIEAPVSSLFTLKTLWVPLCILVVILILSAIIPGIMYSGIPVTQLFHKYTNGNTLWKKLLLFIQFAGVAFIFGITIVAYLQYQRVVNFDLGYENKNMAGGYLYNGNDGNMEVASSTIRNLPMVEKLVLSQLPVGNRYTMDWIKDTKGENLFLAGLNWITPEFVDMHEFVFVEGRNLVGPGEVLVNEEFVRRMGWTDGAIGKSNGNNFMPGIIVGVLKDFVDNSLFEEKNPLFFVYEPHPRYITVQLREPFHESLLKLNTEVKELFSATDIVFNSLEQKQTDRYLSVRRFRDSAGVAFAAILIIALMGLFGYINDEIQRRSKEIGIRKVNGAQAGNILGLLSKDIIIVALPAVIIGTFLSYFIGREWLNQFSGTQIDLNIPFYILLVIIMIVLITTSVISKSWPIANDNPVNSIRND